MTELKTITQNDLNNILDLHRLWMDSKGKEGKFANLIYANLQGLDLTGANLKRAYLTLADFRGADFTGVNISHFTKEDFLEMTITDETTNLTDVKFKGE